MLVESVSVFCSSCIGTGSDGGGDGSVGIGVGCGLGLSMSSIVAPALAWIFKPNFILPFW